MRILAKGRVDCWRDRAAAALLVLAAVPGTPACRAEAQDPPDLKQAELDLADARDRLEKVVGTRLLGLEPPPIPEVPKAEVSPAERELIDRLFESPPDEWTLEERSRLGAVLAREVPRVAAIGARGDVVTTEGLVSRSVPLLNATRLLSLRDRLRLLDGDEAGLLDGLELRTGLALRLMLQPNLVGPLLGTAVQRRVLDDARPVVLRPGTERATLERIDALLVRWRLEAPDAAAAIARETLSSLEASPDDEDFPRELGADDPARALFTAPWAEVMAELAEGCRKVGCRQAIAALRDVPDSDEDPYDVIAEMMIPNLVHATQQVADAQDLTRLAQVAVALRLEALEAGAYPVDVEPVAAGLGLTPEQTERIDYELRPDGGARLEIASDAIVADALPRHRELLGRLTRWELPLPPPSERPEEASARTEKGYRMP